ncbi:glycoside hydrolase family 3 protein [Herbiconiux daphne]|uniref:beta-glucosidase n=1 Tax=Herbiconiux daphne TaxID=2970914 RepID=A0ABT2H732_9MICO|nr:glycoside hydrolase family 3 N-terminal domain-containing protein [Herbiconiux daphne]MCS5735723.1 glycoside hydrolase family 3 C-terminal domain-containing protein [Herbiconiux daphne]
MPRTIDYPWQDALLSPEQRADDLVARLDLADKAGQLFHQITAVADIHEAHPVFEFPSLASMITTRRMTHFNLSGAAPTGREFAAWHNAVQEFAARTGAGIPVTFSTDPRHAFTDNPGTAMIAGPFSQWPETLGLAATRDEELVGRFADIARREYLAVGIRTALHPQVDLATEPRWSRGSATFGEDAELTMRLTRAYIRGFQGDVFGAASVSTMTKHFPGAGPQKDGDDAHFAYGREQVYPGGMFKHHLEPFGAAIDAGTRQMMPYYGMPVGTEYEEVGFAFNKTIITSLLREQLGFEGVVCTDWGLITDAVIFGHPFPARAWGVEHLSREERMLRLLEAGVDQFGGELCTEILLSLVADGRVAESRLDVSVRRLLIEKFALGLFDAPFVDVNDAVIVGSEEFRAAGYAAQQASVTVLRDRPVGNEVSTLPLKRGIRLYVEGLAPESVAAYAELVKDPSEADAAILRLSAPYETRGEGFESFFHNGSLDFAPETVKHVETVARSLPTIVDVYLDRPAILAPIDAVASGLVATYGCADSALLDVLFGAAPTRAQLPFDLPRSMAAIETSREDVPFDTENPLYRFGHGIALN